MPGGQDERGAASSAVVVALLPVGAGAAAAAADCRDDIALKVRRIGALCTTVRWPRAVALCKQLLQIIVPACGGVGRVEVGHKLAVVVLKVQVQKFLGRQLAPRLTPHSEWTAGLVRVQIAGDIQYEQNISITKFHKGTKCALGFLFEYLVLLSSNRCLDAQVATACGPNLHA